MRRFILAVGVIMACTIGCSQSGDNEMANSTARPIAQLAGTAYGDFVIGEPITHDNLTIFPISSKSPKNIDRYITLDEGLANGSIRVIETGAEQTDDDAAASDREAIPSRQISQPPSPQLPPTPADSPERDNDDDNPFGCEEDADDDTKQPSAPAQQPPADQPATVATQEVADPADDLFGSPRANNNIDIPFRQNIDIPFRQSGVGGDVNKLMVLNTSGKPLYLMPGEIISGGNQDRTIGQEIVIDSSEKPVPIDVFCVEQGRWGGRSVASTVSQLAAAADFDSNLSLVVSATHSVNIDERAKEAQQGKFVASLGHLSKDGRLAVQQDGAQGKVWEEVAKQNSKVGNESESENFAANYASEDISKAVEPFVKKLMPAGETQQIVGVAVAVNGKMLSVDVFESTPLFKKFWPRLLKSYALDAVAAKSDKDAGDNDAKKQAKAIGVKDCIAFLKEMENSKAETVELAGGHKIDKRDSAVGASFSYYDPNVAPAAVLEPTAAASSEVGGFGGGVHTSVLAK